MSKNFVIDIFNAFKIGKWYTTIEFSKKNKTDTKYIVAINTTTSKHAECVYNFVKQV